MNNKKSKDSQGKSNADGSVYRHEKYILSYDNENDILYLKLLGLVYAEDLPEFIPRYQKLLADKPRRYLLIDMVESVKMDPSTLNKEMRNAYKELLDQIDIDKAAIFGTTPAMRMVARIALALSKWSNTTKFFKTEDEALGWLKEES